MNPPSMFVISSQSVFHNISHDITPNVSRGALSLQDAAHISESIIAVPRGFSMRASWTTASVAFAGLVCYLYLTSFLPLKKSSNFPFVNGGEGRRRWTDVLRTKREFRSHAKALIAQGFQKFSGPFNIVTDSGPVVMLPPEYIDAVNREPNLDFQKYNTKHTLSKYETFSNFRTPPPGLYEEAVMKGLTRNLPKFTTALSDEMAGCLDDTWADSEEWQVRNLRDDVLSWVARLSSRIFTGEELSKNQDWLRITKDFTINSFTAMAICRMVPLPLRYLAERTLPICRRVREDRRAGARILAPIIAAREGEIAAARREGREPNLPNDSIEWFRTVAKGRVYDDTDVQLGLSVAAIHTTSDLLGQAVLNLGAHPEMVEPLRAEAVAVLQKHGWKKVALVELRILDSFLKETQRLKPIGMSSMHRQATADVELPHGVKLHKGERMAISSHRMWSASDYDDPEAFDGFRFVKRRQVPGYEQRCHLISTSHDHTAFGHGRHACPGRFFAANEIKIAMVHLLLKYDLRLDDVECGASWWERGTSMKMNPAAKICLRRRRAEIDLDALVVAEG
ncbi:uncharacterized protein L3040_004981 [Drepanopeziza brunnea f. sp. 'multigermtubi']|uniref:uncharacterized protein n=1 Tax=Drepanopeziza brunnea f. sp. 'multigermtubi' TaxID=698441 RepID=UPI00239397C3|nr:hypothetical protein L3040_004981 [Drepanopeziza brunnea f. sp. 'multigermtubi']